MGGLVDEIQRDALNDDVPVATILRKVKAAAVKLQLGAVEAWVEHELNGYHGDLPPYRRLVGRPQGFDPYRGWLPILMKTDAVQDVISTVVFAHPIAHLEDLVARSTSSSFEVPFPPGAVRRLVQEFGDEIGRMSNMLTVSQVQSIIDTVRNKVLEWALALESAGVTGEGISFSAQDKTKAQSNPLTVKIGQIGTFAGNLGTANTSGAINQNVANWPAVAEFADKVERAMPMLAAEGVDTKALAKTVDDLRAEVSKTAPDRTVATGLLQDIRNAVSGAAGSLIATGILHQLAAVFPS